MQNIILEAETRESVTNGKLNELRKSGWIPAVLYGVHSGKKSDKNILIKVKEKSLQKTIGSHNAILELKVGNQSDPVLIKEIQRHVVTQRLLHVDFQRVSMTEKLEVMVPLHLVGEAKGVKLSGGILQHLVREIKILALPKDLPPAINLDVSGLEIGHGLLASEIPAIPGVELLIDPHQMIANVVAPTILEETPQAPGTATAAEPEVIAKGKKPEEGEEAAAATAAKPGEKGAAAPKTAGTPAK
ncbi:MAG: 50S ribosomal protein L25 [Elusimicrobia bacterium]|nr:50S ribosomal protein L25 [Elusimicrobiota bacterium]